MIFQFFYVFLWLFNGFGCCLNASISNPATKKNENEFRRQPRIHSNQPQVKFEFKFKLKFNWFA